MTVVVRDVLAGFKTLLSESFHFARDVSLIVTVLEKGEHPSSMPNHSSFGNS